MSGLDADARLRRALAVSAGAAQIDLAIVRSAATRWASATFTGARHELELAGTASDAAERWLAELPEAELPLAGHLVADLKIVAMTQAERDLTVTLEVLTLEER